MAQRSNEKINNVSICFDKGKRMYGVMKRKRRLSQDLNLMFGIIKMMFGELLYN